MSEEIEIALTLPVSMRRRLKALAILLDSTPEQALVDCLKREVKARIERQIAATGTDILYLTEIEQGKL